MLPGSLSGNRAATLTAVPTVTPTPSVTPTATPTQTPTPYPTPYAVVKGDVVRGWRGPDPSFDLLGSAQAGKEMVVLGRTPDSSWLRICCIANQPAWVRSDTVVVKGVLDTVKPISPPSTPTAVPTATRTATPLPTPTRKPPFDIARGPEFPFRVDTGVLTIFAKVYEGPKDNEKPVGGYMLRVLRDGVDVSQPEQLSHNKAAEFETTGKEQGGYLVNLKYEMRGAGEADWLIWLAHPDGTIVSPQTSFTTKGSAKQNLVVFIAYHLVR